MHSATQARPNTSGKLPKEHPFKLKILSIYAALSPVCIFNSVKYEIKTNKEIPMAIRKILLLIYARGF